MGKDPLLPGMTASITNHDAIRSYVEVLAVQLDPSPLERIRIAPARHPGSYVSARISLSFGSGRHQRIFLKELSQPFRAKNSSAERRRREVYVYEHLLNGADLGTAQLLAVHRNRSSGRCWLVLEFVEGTVIEDPADQLAVEAVAWLARMQSRFLSHPALVGADTELPRHDTAFFSSPVEEARRQVALISPASVGRFGELLDRYEPVVELLATQPRSLVHGGYIPWHVFVDASADPLRVTAIDWELAAAGSPLFDLAYFTDWADAHVQDRLHHAYRLAAEAHGVPLPDRESMERIISGLRLHRTVEWLSKSVARRYPPTKVAKLVRRAESLITGT